MEKEYNILIIGKEGITTSLAKHLKNDCSVNKIFISPLTVHQSEIYESIDIREDDISGLLKFVLENNIHLTIATSKKSISSGIVSFFQENGQCIFAPDKNAAKFVLNKIYAKKFLYKLHAQTSRFFIYDKNQTGQDFLKKSNYPIVIKDETSTFVCSTLQSANRVLMTIPNDEKNGILIEEYVYGNSFTVYFITDGYSILPITSCANFKNESLTSFDGCFVPNYKISNVVILRLQNIMDNIICNLAQKGTPYLGIIGVECFLTGEDKFYINNFRPFFEDYDINAVLNSIDDDLLKIFLSCVNGFFADDYETIKTNNLYNISIILKKKASNSEPSSFDIVKINKNSFVLTKTSSTLKRAKELLLEDLYEENFSYPKGIFLD